MTSDQATPEKPVKLNRTAAASSGRSGLAKLLEDNLPLSAEVQGGLAARLADNLLFYQEYNESRLKLAYTSFDEDMKYALFELFFLLHVNHPQLADWAYTARSFETRNGQREKVETHKKAQLYLEGAPAGIKGLEQLSPLMKNDFEAYVHDVFGMDPYAHGKAENMAIVALQSVGSTGTIGHKSQDSDLDLQVIYDEFPLTYDTSHWGNTIFSEALNREHKLWINHFRKKQQIGLEDLRKEAVRKQLSSLATRKVANAYPNLYRVLVKRDTELAENLEDGQNTVIRQAALHEIIALMTRAPKLAHGAHVRKQEMLLKKRLKIVQEYINNKFPSAEVYLFVYTTREFRQGQYGSTLEFKESSVSAYEYILNYETLMPGIQFLPLVPTHFLLPRSTNNDPVQYGEIIDYIRFQALPSFEGVRENLLDLGAAPEMDVTYVAAHGGAIYWEAFKASSGNLPKAILNLFRFEMLLDLRFLKTIIQMIKDPVFIDEFATPLPEDNIKQLAYQARLGQMKTGMHPAIVLEIEQKYPELRRDPWWLRYKALKIGYCEQNGVDGIQSAERDRISNIIDLSFCMHLRISDVLKLAEEGQEGSTHREKVMLELLETAFPKESSRRIYLQNLLSGDARGLIFFENEMRDLFRRCMTRVEQKMAQFGVHDHVGEKREVELWLNYYLENFQPALNVVPRVIMKHLKVPRDGIEISYRPNEGWVFMSLQRKLTNSGLPIRRTSKTNFIPERLTLLDETGFAMGLAHCIMNGYIGIQNKGTDQERETTIELVETQLDQGNSRHNDLAHLTEDQVNRLARRIMAVFPYNYIDYTDIIQMERKITTVLVCLNIFRFGQLSVLFRNNINTWYCEETEVREMLDQSLEFAQDMNQLLRFKPLHDQLGEIFKKHRIDLKEVTLSTWANSNSLGGGHTADFLSRNKSMEEGSKFTEIILANQGIQQ